ncbi:uncharacterized protein [Aristolochia californica]|uniref:uncharacterized protein n=1 Tax=Aristolochia californica TaxID=171875 RepID=UPI0035D5A0E0
MVRSKLEMKFIGDERTRCKVFKKRVEGVKKKGHQLSLLCGIDVFFLCSPPESEKEFSPHSWPPNKAELLRILTREEAKQRLEFPKGMRLVCEGASDRKIETQPTVDHSHNLWLVSEMEPQRSNSAYLPISYMNPFQQSQTGLGLPSEEFSQWLLPTCD